MSCQYTFIFVLFETFLAHKEAKLKGLNKSDLIEMVLQLKSKMNSGILLEIRDLVTQMKNVEVDVAIVKNINEKLVNQLIETERECWVNAQYLRWKSFRGSWNTYFYTQ